MKMIKRLVAACTALFFGFAAKATVTVTSTELIWTNGVAVSQSLTATSRTITSPTSITWTEDSATSKLPSGVTFSDGSFTGTPTEEGEFDWPSIESIFTECAKDSLSYAFTPESAGDHSISFYAYTGTEPDFTSRSNILGQYSWSVTEMARPAPSYEFSIEPGSYEW